MRTIRKTSPTPPTPGSPAAPRGPLSPEQQRQALERLQDQAEQRVRIGIELLQAAESRVQRQDHSTRQLTQRVDELARTLEDERKLNTQRHEALVRWLRSEHTKLRSELTSQLQTHSPTPTQLAAQAAAQDALHRDVASSLQTYDQWLAKFDQSFTTRLNQIEQKLNALTPTPPTQTSPTTSPDRKGGVLRPPTTQPTRPHQPTPPTKTSPTPPHLTEPQPDNSPPTPPTNPTITPIYQDLVKRLRSEPPPPPAA